MLANRKLLVKYALLFFWLLVIFILSSEGSSTSTGRSDFIAEYIGGFIGGFDEDTRTFLVRKSAHIIAYLILGLLIYNVVRIYRLDACWTVLLCIALALVYAISDEVHQLFVPGRSGELRDVLIDTTAASIGIIGFALLDRNLKIVIKSKII